MFGNRTPRNETHYHLPENMAKTRLRNLCTKLVPSKARDDIVAWCGVMVGGHPRVRIVPPPPPTSPTPLVHGMFRESGRWYDVVGGAGGAFCLARLLTRARLTACVYGGGCSCRRTGCRRWGWARPRCVTGLAFRGITPSAKRGQALATICTQPGLALLPERFTSSHWSFCSRPHWSLSSRPRGPNRCGRGRTRAVQAPTHKGHTHTSLLLPPPLPHTPPPHH